MEISITSTSVTPPKATLTSFASSKDQLTGIGNDSRSVLGQNLGVFGHNIDSEPEHLHDHLNPNQQYPYQEPLRNFRLEPGLPSEALFDINEHGYTTPLDQTNPNSFYYGSSLPGVQDEVIGMHTLPPVVSSRYQPISTESSTSLEMPCLFLPGKRRYETDDKFEMKDSKAIPASLVRGCETTTYRGESESSIIAEMKDTAPSTNAMETVEVTLQLPGIETFSSPVSPTFLSSSKLSTNEPNVPNTDSVKGEKSLFSFDSDSLVNNPYVVSNEHDIPSISNIDEPNDEVNRNATAVIPLITPNLIPGNQLSTLPQYPCVPSPNKTFPLSQPPLLPINYRPLLENLRPIRRTEEIVRLKNDGGKITIVETTDDPGKSKF